MKRHRFHSSVSKQAFLVCAIFCGFLLVALNVGIDPRAMDITLIPRLLLLQFFLLFAVVFVAWSPLAKRFDYGILRDPLIICFALYALTTASSLFFAVNLSAGLTDVFKTFASLIVLVLACLLFSLYPHWTRCVLKAAVVAAILALGIGIHDWWTGPGLGLHPRSEMEAVTGLMSNVNLYASFVLLLLPLSAVAAVVLQSLWRWTALLGSSALLAVLVALQTRAVYLGLAASLAVMLWALFRQREPLGPATNVRRALRIVVPLLILTLAGLLWFAPAAEPVFERIRATLDNRTMTAAGGRPVIWLASLRMVRDHPITGVGAGNFPVKLHDYFDVDDPEFSTIHPNWLQPHNDYLWVLAEKGLLGFVLYASIWVIAFLHLRRALSSRLSPDQAWTAVATIGGLAGYAVVSFFDFPMERINHQVYFAFYLAIAVQLGGRHTVKAAGSPAMRIARSAALAVMAILLVGCLYSVTALKQERLIRLSREAFVQEDWAETKARAAQAATAWKTLDPFAVPVAYLQGMGHLMLAEHDDALVCFEQARQEMPSRAYIARSLALVYGFLGNYGEAIDLYEGVLSRSPGNPDILQSLADVYLRSGDVPKARQLLEAIPAEHWTDTTKAINRRIQRALESTPQDPG